MAWSRVLFVLLMMTTAARASSNDDLRVRLHLERVEAVLRARAPVGLGEAQRVMRARMLDHLHAYIERGEFPRNHEVAGRRPHFIDEDGRICAVGYLVEQSAGRATAEAINLRHEWDYIRDIHGIETWVAASGLSVDELAMIQPSYEWEQPPVPAPRPPSPRPPPPPPPDERVMQRRILTAALGNAQRDIERCAARFETWGERVTVTASVRVRRSFEISVSSAGSRGFERCVQRAARTAVMASPIARGSLFPVTISYTFALVAARGFAQPPPR